MHFITDLIGIYRVDTLLGDLLKQLNSLSLWLDNLMNIG
jgi:hypothetical protein